MNLGSEWCTRDNDNCRCTLPHRHYDIQSITMKRSRLRVYVAGPMLGSGNPYVNIHRGLEISMTILDRGMAPYIPHLTAILEMTQGERSRDTWLELDKAFLLACDAMLRLPGESPGADQEVVWAVAANIPVFMSLDTLFAWQETRR